MSLGLFPSVPLEDRVYVDVDDHGNFVYVRYRGGVELQVTDDEVDTLRTEWCFYYSTAALEQVRTLLNKGAVR